VELVKRTRQLLGPEGDIMLDCWMALTEHYTIEFAEMVEPYRVYWMEEVLPPDDYAGFGRVHAAIKSTQMATGEHEYTRYGFRLLLEYKAVDIWQPDLHWCGGLSEMRHIGALAAAYNIPVIPHGRMERRLPALSSSPLPIAPGARRLCLHRAGPPEVYQRFEEENNITRGTRGHLYAAFGSPGVWMGIDGRLSTGLLAGQESGDC